MRNSLGVLLFLTAAIASQGQVAPGAGYGGIGDPSISQGSPQVSSYGYGVVDHVNYYNGSVNLTLPLVSIWGARIRYQKPGCSHPDDMVCN
jgi:hypothetical protein